MMNEKNKSFANINKMVFLVFIIISLITAYATYKKTDNDLLNSKIKIENLKVKKNNVSILATDDYNKKQYDE